MALGGKAPGRQTVIIVAVLVAFVWFFAVFRGTDTLTSTPVSQCLASFLLLCDLTLPATELTDVIV